ncbi:MAG: type II toxin-antitoxin system RelE/ParE family toxin [Phycisphaerales bacterium JB039]
MKRALAISARAQVDLLEIWLWTHDRFGDAQADRYLDELDAGIRACATRPESGKDREAIRPGYRSRLFGKHIVFYTFTDTEVVIQRVLHASMDVEDRLSD